MKYTLSDVSDDAIIGMRKITRSNFNTVEAPNAFKRLIRKIPGLNKLVVSIEQIKAKGALSVKNIPFGKVITSFTGLRAVGDTGDFIIGHSDVAFTKRQYANTQITQLERGMERFSNFVAGITG